MLGLIPLLFPKVREGIGNLWDDITGVTAAETAAEAQREGYTQAQGTIDSQMQQQQEMMDLLMQQFQPFQQAGQGALTQMQGLSGGLGAEAQQQAIDALQNSPLFQAQLQQGQNAMLQSAAATGGLRGGNTQAALGQFAPALLQQTIQNQMANLGGLAGMGLQGAGGVASGIAGTQDNLRGLAGGLAGLQAGLGDVNAAAAMAPYQLQRDFGTDAIGLGLNLFGALSGGGF